MIFSGLRPPAKMILKASTREGPFLFFNGTTHAYLFGKHIDAHQQVAITIVKFLHGLHIGQIHLLLLINTAHDHAIYFKTTTYGFMESVRILFHQPFFDFCTVYVEFSLFFHILIQTIDTANPPERFGSQYTLAK